MLNVGAADQAARSGSMRSACASGRSAAASAARLANQPSIADEPDQQHQPGGDQHEGLRRAPAGGVGADDAQHEHRQADRRGERAGEVEVDERGCGCAPRR